jgi:hypothetical protein
MKNIIDKEKKLKKKRLQTIELKKQGMIYRL